MVLITAHLNAGNHSGGDSVTINDRYIISLSPHLHTPFPSLSPSLISLMVSVDVKHHVYLLTVRGSQLSNSIARSIVYMQSVVIFKEVTDRTAMCCLLDHE